jgi:tetratricopeptide (TPR) repeat protein/O-antigen ligase
MNTKLQAWCAGAAETAVLLTAAAVPVFVNFYSFRVFDLNKAAILITLSTVIAVVGLIALIEGLGAGPGAGTGKALGRAVRRPLVAAALLLALTTAIATATSILPRLSFFGSAERMMGLMTLLTTLLLFGAVAWLAREPARRGRIVGMLIAASVPVSLFAITQWLGLEVVPGEVESANRAFGTIANPIFLGAYLMLLWPLTASRVVQAAQGNRPGPFVGYFIIAAVQLLALLATDSRGPLAGWAVGLFVLLLAGGIASGRRWLGWTAVGAATAGLIFVAVFNLPNTPLEPLRSVPVIGRFGRLADTSSGSEAARIRIWRSVDRMLAAEPARLVTGRGPETLKHALIPYAETYVSGRGQAGRLVDRAHNVLLDALATTGIPGALALLLVYGTWLWTAAVAAGLAPARSDRRLLALLLVIGTTLGLTAWLTAPLYAGAATFLGLLAGLAAYLFLALLSRRSADAGEDAEVEAEPVAQVATANRASGSAAEGSAGSTLPRAAESRGLAVALLAVGAAAIAEAAFGIQTVVTQTVFWALAGLVVTLGAGDRVAAVAARVPAAVRQRSRGEAAAEPESGGVTITWSHAGAALGLVTGAALGLVIYDFILFGTALLADTLPVVGLLCVAMLLAGLLVATDVGESRVACLIMAVVAFILYIGLRGLTWIFAQDASWVYAMTLLWLVVLVPLGGLWLRGTVAPNTPAAAGVVAILYPVLALPAMALIWLVAVQPVRADIYFQSAVANFDAGIQTDNATLFANAEELFKRATDLNSKEDGYYLLWGERFTKVGVAAADVAAAAQAFGRAQELVRTAESLDPLMPYHAFNRGQLQLSFAQKLTPGSQESLDAAANAVVALQSVFDKAPYDPQVAGELALAKLVAGDVQGAIELLEFSRDTLDDQNSATFRLLGQAYYAADDPDKAQAALQQALELDAGAGVQERAATALTLAEIARQRGDHATAIQYYEEVLAAGAGDWRVLFNLGLVYRDQGTLDKALAAITQVQRVAPQDEATQAQIQAALDSVLVKKGVPVPGATGGP